MSERDFVSRRFDTRKNETLRSTERNEAYAQSSIIICVTKMAKVDIKDIGENWAARQYRS